MGVKKETLLVGGFSDVLVDYGYKLLVCNYVGLQFWHLERIFLKFSEKRPFQKFLAERVF